MGEKAQAERTVNIELEVETCLECQRNSKESDRTRTEGWGSDRRQR